MKCFKCNAVNPNGSVFCCKCGTKLSVNNTGRNVNYNDPKQKELTFSFCGRDFAYPPIYTVVADILGPFYDEAWGGYCELKKVFSEKEKNMDTAIKYSVPAFMSCFGKLADILYGMCLKVGSVREDFNQFVHLFYACCDIDHRLSPIIDAAESLSKYAQQLKSYRSAQRDSRGHWQGGGFGIGGAIRGAIKASLLNAGTNAVYSICDGITNQRDMQEYNKVDLQLYFKIRPSLLLKQLFVDCCEAAGRLFVVNLSEMPALPEIVYDSNEINSLNREYQAKKEIIERFGIDDYGTEEFDYIDSICDRIDAYPFDIYPYWDFLLFLYDDFHEVESVFKTLHISSLHRMKYDMVLIETGYKLSNLKYTSLNELNNAIDTLKWLKTSKFYNPSFDSTISMLERKRADFT